MIEINDLTKYYDDVCVVDHISLAMNQGEILGLLGPNGAGKTTTLRMLMCYLAPTSGGIRVKDLSVADRPLEVKRLFGYLPESAPLYPDMLVYDSLRFVANVRGLDGSAGGRRSRSPRGPWCSSGARHGGGRFSGNSGTKPDPRKGSSTHQDAAAVQRSKEIFT